MKSALSAVAIALATMLPVAFASAGPAETAKAVGKDASWLFIQTAGGLRFDGTTITLTGIDPAMVMFSDRPHRVAESIPLSAFVEGWSRGGSKGFRADPPNAGVTTLVDGKFTTATVELTEPRLSGSTLTYRVRVLGGTVPQSGGPTSVFIDSGCTIFDPRC